MNRNKLRKEIAELINSIKQHSDEIGTQKHIPQIELELILSKIKRLYEKSVVYNYLTSQDEGPGRRKEESDDEMTVVDISEVPLKSVPPPEMVEPVVVPVPSAHEAPPAPLVEKKHVASPASETFIPGKNIKSLIGINEKFQFTKELFGNKAEEYNKAIDEINSCEDKNKLERNIRSLSDRYGWQDEDKVVQAFKNLCHRKF